MLSLRVVLAVSIASLASCAQLETKDDFDRMKARWQFSTNEIYNQEDYEYLKILESFPDRLTDLVLDEVRRYLTSTNDTFVKIPPVNVGFQETILGIEFDGKFKTSDGWFTNPATIERRGESNFHGGLMNLTLSTTVGFKLIEVYFENYEASIIGISEQGDVKVKIGKNSLFLEINAQTSLTTKPHCVITLTKVHLDEFSQISTDISGLSILNPLADQITDWVLASYRTSFTDLVEKIVSDKLRDVLSHTSLCRFKSTPVKKDRRPFHFRRPTLKV